MDLQHNLPYTENSRDDYIIRGVAAYLKPGPVRGGRSKVWRSSTFECADGALSMVKTLQQFQEVLEARAISSARVKKPPQVYNIRLDGEKGRQPTFYNVCNALRYRSFKF